MTDIYSDEYWLNEFTITQNDLIRIADKMLRDQKPQDLKTIAIRIIKGRLEHGHDISPAALQNLTGKASVRLWDPEENWQIGELVLVARLNAYNSLYEPFLGKIISISSEYVELYIEEMQESVTYGRLLPGTKVTKKHGAKADIWRNTVKEAVTKKLQSKDLASQAEGIFLQYGEKILNSIISSLESDKNFIGLGDSWYLTSELFQCNPSKLKNLYNNFLKQDVFSLEEAVMYYLEGERSNYIIWQMSIRAGLDMMPERFESIGNSLHPQWRVLPPTPEKAKVKYHAYDPNTYEVLCLPGQLLEVEKANRLMDLNLYKSMVTFMDED